MYFFSIIDDVLICYWMVQGIHNKIILTNNVLPWFNRSNKNRWGERMIPCIAKQAADLLPTRCYFPAICNGK